MGIVNAPLDESFGLRFVVFRIFVHFPLHLIQDVINIDVIVFIRLGIRRMLFLLGPFFLDELIGLYYVVVALLVIGVVWHPIRVVLF